MTFTDWSPDDPNNLQGIEDCLELRKAADFKWNDASCDDKKYFVCEEEISMYNN